MITADGGDTEFADTRTAYDTFDDRLKAELGGHEAHHSIAYSREVLGFEFSAEEKDALKGATHPLIYRFDNNGRSALYVASHASRNVDYPIAEGRFYRAS